MIKTFFPTYQLWFEWWTSKKVGKNFIRIQHFFHSKKDFFQRFQKFSFQARNRTMRCFSLVNYMEIVRDLKEDCGVDNDFRMNFFLLVISECRQLFINSMWFFFNFTAMISKRRNHNRASWERWLFWIYFWSLRLHSR